MKRKFIVLALIIMFFVSCEAKNSDSISENDFAKKFSLKEKYDRETERLRLEPEDRPKASSDQITNLNI